jgi:hypothetical protein
MPDPPVEVFEKKYEVVGRNSFRLDKTEYKTGEKFTASFTAEQEQFYVEGGLLRVVKTQSQKKEE